MPACSPGERLVLGLTVRGKQDTTSTPLTPPHPRPRSQCTPITRNLPLQPDGDGTMEPISAASEPLLREYSETQSTTPELRQEEDDDTSPCQRNGGENLGPSPGSPSSGDPRDSDAAAIASCSVGGDGRIMIDGVHLV